MFKINERFSKKNYYLSLLPKYRTTPVFIFEKNGSIVFENKSANVQMPNINIANSLNYFGGGLRMAKKNIIGVLDG